MYKKTWCTCKAVVLLIKPIAFFDAQPLQKQAKQTGVSCCCGKHCWLTLCFAGRVFCVTSFGVCTHPKHQETTKQTKRNHNKNQEPCKSESFARRYFFLFTSIRSPVPGYQVENASPKTVNKALWQPFQPGLPRNLKVANRKPQKTARFWTRLKISFQSCELSMKWTLVSCMSYLWLPVTSTDLIISVENKDLSSNISLSTFLKILFRFNYNHFVIKYLWAVTYIWSPVFTSLPSSNK